MTPSRTRFLFVVLLGGFTLCAAAGGAWRAVGPPGGRIAGLALDPADPSRLYVAAQGGVWRSDDRGSTWVGINDGLRALSVFGVTVAPGGLLYAATNEGVFKSSDRGGRWTAVSSGLESDLGPIPIGRVVLDPTSPSTLYATSAAGLFRSRDEARSWSYVGPRLDSQIRDVVVSPLSPSTLYIATVGGGVSRSTDAGATWSLVLDPSDFELAPIVLDLLMDPLDPSVLYASGVAVFKTENGGGSWRVLGDRSVGPRLVNDLALARDDPSLLLAATAAGLYRSESAGEEWTMLEEGLPVLAFMGEEDRQLTHAAIDPLDPRYAYVGSFAGLFVTGDGGATWNRTPRLSTRSISALALSGPNGRRVLASNFDIPEGGVFASDDGGASWDRQIDGLPLPTVIELGAAPVDPQIVYAGVLGTETSTSGVYRSLDGGLTWHARSEGLAGPLERNVAAMTIHRQDPSIVFIGGPAGVFRTLDGGGEWVDFGDERLERALVDARQAYVSALALLTGSESDPERVFAAVPSQGVFASPTTGASWSDLSAGLEDLEVVALAVDERDPGALWSASLDGEVSHRPGNGPWERRGAVGASAPVTALLVDPREPDTLLVGTYGDSVHRSEDGGRTWARFDDGLSFPAVQVLAADRSDPPVLYAGTSGGGLFALRDEGSLPPNACVDDLSAMCLSDRRFRVSVRWRTADGESGAGQRVSSGTSDSGLFWFFAPENWEMLVKVLDACAVNGHYWVFGALATDVEFTLSVEDQVTATAREYVHALGTAAEPITDTAAFPCP